MSILKLTLNVTTKKIKSAPKFLPGIIMLMVHRRTSFVDSVKRVGSPSYLIAGMMLLVVGAAAFLMVSQLKPTVTLYLGDGIFDARIAKTQIAIEKGLGGVESLGPRDALILVFPKDDTWKIATKDMKVSIDIVWLDQNKKVVYSVKNVEPDNTTVFVSNSPARYVIEVPAGSVEEYNIKAGRAVIFDIPQEEAK